ncbi:MAG TPA: cysteine desulfurase family protein [bacterium]|nr:cysteine desulfurase family protein [bacterium]HPL95223.1 cysteine desulfurase family protein [bacterium]
MKIYFDHAATTPVDKQVLEAMQPYFSEKFGNASSVHSFGQEAEQAVSEARKRVADFLNCNSEEIIFTSGATEADNLAIIGICHPELFSGSLSKETKPHIITTAFEHPAVLETCKYLEKKGVEVSYVKPDSEGIIHVEDIEKEIKNNTILISVMYVNNEIGTVQPIKNIGDLLKKINAERTNKIYFHTDAVQATLYQDMNVENLGVDLMSISGHKIYGPKGIGVLYVKKNTPLKNIQHGGHHEFGKRAGTLNTPGIVGMGQAIELIKDHDQEKIKNLRDYLWSELQKNISDLKLNGSLEKRTPGNLNFSVNGVEGEALLLGLDLAGVAISTGSACSSGSLEPSHVLMAIGLSHELAHGSLRITLGYENTKEECDQFVKTLKPLVEKFRAMAPKG